MRRWHTLGQVRVQSRRFLAISAQNNLLVSEHGRVGAPIFHQHQLDGLQPVFPRAAKIPFAITAGSQPQQAAR